MENKLRIWAKKVVDTYNSLGKTFYTQSPLNAIKESPAVLILGINPGSDMGELCHEVTPEEFLEGNKCFEEREAWRIWQRLKRIFVEGGMDGLLADNNKYVFSNIFHCATPKAENLPHSIKTGDIIKLTQELIECLRPELIICLGLGKDVSFEVLANSYNAHPLILIDSEMKYFNVPNLNIPVYGIPHTSKFYTHEEYHMIGCVLGALYKKEVIPDKSSITNMFSKEIKTFKDRQKQLKPINIKNWMIKQAFYEFINQKRVDCHGWFEFTEGFIAQITSTGGGEVIIRHAEPDSNGNYKNNQYKTREYQYRDEVIQLLCSSDFGFIVDTSNTSLGHKPFSKYSSYKDNPEQVILEIGKELEKIAACISQLRLEKR